MAVSKFVFRDEQKEQEQEVERCVAIKFERCLTEDLEEHFDNVQEVIDYINETLKENSDLINGFILGVLDMLDHVQFYMTQSYIGNDNGEGESHD